MPETLDQLVMSRRVLVTVGAGGVGKSRALPGRDPTGAASRRLAAVPRFPGPVVARRYAPTGTGATRQAAIEGGASVSVAGPAGYAGRT